MELVIGPSLAFLANGTLHGMSGNWVYRVIGCDGQSSVSGDWVKTIKKKCMVAWGFKPQTFSMQGRCAHHHPTAAVAGRQVVLIGLYHLAISLYIYTATADIHHHKLLCSENKLCGGPE